MNFFKTFLSLVFIVSGHTAFADCETIADQNRIPKTIYLKNSDGEIERKKNGDPVYQKAMSERIWTLYSVISKHGSSLCNSIVLDANELVHKNIAPNFATAETHKKLPTYISNARRICHHLVSNPSIMLAQMALETGWFGSAVAVKNNNLSGIHYESLIRKSVYTTRNQDKWKNSYGFLGKGRPVDDATAAKFAYDYSWLRAHLTILHSPSNGLHHPEQIPSYNKPHFHECHRYEPSSSTFVADFYNCLENNGYATRESYHSSLENVYDRIVPYVSCLKKANS